MKKKILAGCVFLAGMVAAMAQNPVTMRSLPAATSVNDSDVLIDSQATGGSPAYVTRQLTGLQLKYYITGGGSLDVTSGKTLGASNTLTFAGTDGSALNIGSGGTLGTGAFASVYALPAATSGTIGGVKPGTDLTVASDGTLNFAPPNENANLVLAGPASGSAGAPTFRALVPADIPSLSYQTPLTFGSPLSNTGGTVSLTNSGVTAGSFTNANITVDGFGRVTAAANGTGASATSGSYLLAGNGSGGFTNVTTLPSLLSYSSGTLSISSSAAPTFSGANLTSLNPANLSGAVPVTLGGTGRTSLGTNVATALGANIGANSGLVINPMTLLGDMIYGGPGASPYTLQGNTANSDEVLVSHGTGSSATPPYWWASPALNGSNFTSLNASNLASGTVPTARLGSGTASSSTYLRGDGTWATPGGGGGTVTSVSLTGDGVVYPATAGSAVTSSGTLTLPSPGNESAHAVFVGPVSGSAATPSFRALAAADIPSLSYQTPITFGTNVQTDLGNNIGGSGGLVADAAGTTTIYSNLTVPGNLTVSGNAYDVKTFTGTPPTLGNATGPLYQFGYATDTGNLYVGNGTTNYQVGGTSVILGAGTATAGTASSTGAGGAVGTWETTGGTNVNLFDITTGSGGNSTSAYGGGSGGALGGIFPGTYPLQIQAGNGGASGSGGPGGPGGGLLPSSTGSVISVHGGIGGAGSAGSGTGGNGGALGQSALALFAGSGGAAPTTSGAGAAGGTIFGGIDIIGGAGGAGGTTGLGGTGGALSGGYAIYIIGGTGGAASGAYSGGAGGGDTSTSPIDLFGGQGGAAGAGGNGGAGGALNQVIEIGGGAGGTGASSGGYAGGAGGASGTISLTGGNGANATTSAAGGYGGGAGTITLNGGVGGNYGANSYGGAAGAINLNGGVGGYTGSGGGYNQPGGGGGSINTSGGYDVSGNPGGSGGSISTFSTSSGVGGGINTSAPGSGSGGSINTYGSSSNGTGGNINTYGGPGHNGGSLNLAANSTYAGGSIVLSNAVNTIQTSGSTADTITIPNTTGTSDTFAVLGTAQTFTAAQTFTGGLTIGSAGTSLSNLALVSKTLASGSVTVSDTTVTTGTHFFPVSESSGVTGALRVSVTSGTGYTVTSNNGSDAGSVELLRVN